VKLFQVTVLFKFCFETIELPAVYTNRYQD